MTNENNSDFLIIPFKELTPPTLRKVIESYVLQEGTDYGDLEYSLDQKVMQVERLLAEGKAMITFDQQSETCNVRLADSCVVP